jgi:hypothetical protein
MIVRFQAQRYSFTLLQIHMKRIMFLLSVVVLLLAAGEQAYSLPAFARKYKTSCATCHVGFPKLNAFGEAFRRNGYQFPGHTDLQFMKEDPVSLGADGNKAAFPDAIWPGSIPGSSPISLFLDNEVDYNPKANPRFSFAGLGNAIEPVAGGTLGEDVSFWMQASLNFDGTVELNRIMLIFSNLIGDSYALNARIGVIEPGIFSFSTHRAWMEGYWMTTRPFSNDMAWTLEETQRGLELNGMAGGRFGYSAGLVEGFGAAHDNKDIYEHVTYKFGGLPLDGVVENGSAQDNSQPYIDNSLTLGAFGYEGNAVIGPDSASQTNTFTMFGGDFNAWIDRFNLFGGVGLRTDDQPFVGVLNQNAKTTVWFAELDVVAYPWLLPGVRVESWKSQMIDPASGNVTDYSDMQIVPGITFLVRPNVKFNLRTSLGKFDKNSTYGSDNDPNIQAGNTNIQPGMVQLLLAVGF